MTTRYDPRAKYSDAWCITDADRQAYARRKYEQLSEADRVEIDHMAAIIVERCRRITFYGALTVLVALGSFVNERAR